MSEEKLNLISQVVVFAHEEDHNYSNPVKAKVYTDLKLLSAYSNISFTDKQKEDTPKLYDTLLSSGLMDLVLNAIPTEEKEVIYKGVHDTITSLYSYQNSVLGLLDNITNSYDTSHFDIKALQEAIKELEDSKLMKELAPMLGLE